MELIGTSRSAMPRCRRALLPCCLVLLASGALGVQPMPPASPSLSQVTGTNSSTALAATAAGRVRGVTFVEFYQQYQSGPGIWKWSNALEAYDRHFSRYVGREMSIAEVGVQSGGSIQMWHAVMGPRCQVFGIDINPQTKQFEDKTTNITIGDQADTAMWQSFYGRMSRPLDVLIDDGGHESHQMLVTLQQTFWRLGSSGVVAIEDIHGESYVDSFFVPAAQFLSAMADMGALDSIHVYPFLLLVQRAAGPEDARSELSFSGTSAKVAQFDELWQQVPLHPGGHIILENAGWGPFFTAPGIANFFKTFSGLHTSNWYDAPKGCATTSAAVCTNTVQNDPLQAAITGLHIYPTRIVVEVASKPVLIQAVRKGTVWIGYGL